MQRSCLFICSVLGTHPISCAICVSVAICINFHRKKKKKKKKNEHDRYTVAVLEEETCCAVGHLPRLISRECYGAAVSMQKCI